MAAVLKLSRISSGATTDLNLLDTSGLYLEAVPGWIPKTAVIGPDGIAGDVTEVLTLDINGAADHDDVATTTQLLSDMVRYNNNYWRDPDRDAPVWLYSKLDSETNGRRALVKDLSWQWLSEHYTEEMISFKPRLRLTIQRNGAWEQLTQSTFEEVAAISSVGGTFDYTGSPAADTVGTLPARLNDLSMWASAANMSSFWGGIRSAELHNLGSYDPVWTFATSFAPGTDAADVLDATAKDGERMEVDFAGTTGWASRTNGGGESLGADSAGDHIMLLRAYVDGTMEADVKIAITDVGASDGVVYTDITRISATSWTIHPLIGLMNYAEFPTVNLWARRAVGSSGKLYLDCITLIPVDALYLFSEGTGTIGTNSGAALRLSVRPEGTIRGQSSVITQWVHNVQMEGAGVPIGDGLMVICATRASRASTLTDTLTLKMNHVQRWLGLRGDE